jgi:hypothetical protein
MKVMKMRPSPAMVVALIALFVALGGSAAALSGSNTVQSDDLGPGAQVKAPDVADNAVNGADVLNGSLTLSDLNATSRPHKLEFSTPIDPAPPATIATVGHLRVSGQCLADGSVPFLNIYLKNLAGQQGTMSALLTNQIVSDSNVSLNTVGRFVGAGVEITLDRFDNHENAALASGNFDRVQGQVVFRTPGRVTTIDLHAFTAGPSNPRCEFYGTAVTSNLS